MKELKNLIDYMVGFGEALQRGVDNFVIGLPKYTKQQITTFAGQKLHSTKQHYLDSLSIKVIDYVLVVEIDKDDWLANALENGADPFSMKEGHLRSPKAKTSKLGYRYLRIPIGKEKDGSGGPSKKGQDLQAKINEVLKKPHYDSLKVRTSLAGGVYEMQKVLTSDSQLKGFYRSRKFDSIEEYHSGKKPQWQHVMFRTMSENPMSESKWEHPGLKPANILKETERWLHMEIGNLLDVFIEDELKVFNQSFSEK